MKIDTPKAIQPGKNTTRDHALGRGHHQYEQRIYPMVDTQNKIAIPDSKTHVT